MLFLAPPDGLAGLVACVESRPRFSIGDSRSLSSRLEGPGTYQHNLQGTCVWVGGRGFKILRNASLH